MAAALLASGCASAERAAAAAPAEPTPPAVASWDAFEPESDLTRAYIGPQPGLEALDAFKAAGGTTVVNLRTESEMERLPYYDAAVTGLGLEYVHVPTPGSEMGPAQHVALRSVLDAADGPVLLHCGSGTRATYLWGAHLMFADGRSPEEARAWCAERRDGAAWEAGEAAIDRIAAGE